MSATGSRVNSAGTDGTVRIWDPHTGQTRHTLTGHTGGVEALAVAPDGSWLASAGGDRRRCGSGTSTQATLSYRSELVTRSDSS